MRYSYFKKMNAVNGLSKFENGLVILFFANNDSIGLKISYERVCKSVIGKKSMVIPHGRTEISVSWKELKRIKILMSRYICEVFLENLIKIEPTQLSVDRFIMESGANVSFVNFIANLCCGMNMDHHVHLGHLKFLVKYMSNETLVKYDNLTSIFPLDCVSELPKLFGDADFQMKLRTTTE